MNQLFQLQYLDALSATPWGLGERPPKVEPKPAEVTLDIHRPEKVKRLVKLIGSYMRSQYHFPRRALQLDHFLLIPSGINHRGFEHPEIRADVACFWGTGDQITQHWPWGCSEKQPRLTLKKTGPLGIKMDYKDSSLGCIISHSKNQKALYSEWFIEMHQSIR